MKVISIGKGDVNDVVLSLDPKIADTHCQIIEIDGSFLLNVFTPENETYINGRRVEGENPLLPGDQLIIGQTLLDWQAGFKTSNNNLVMWSIFGVLLLLIGILTAVILVGKGGKASSSENEPIETAMENFDYEYRYYTPTNSLSEHSFDLDGVTYYINSDKQSYTLFYFTEGKDYRREGYIDLSNGYKKRLTQYSPDLNRNASEETSTVNENELKKLRKQYNQTLGIEPENFKLSYRYYTPGYSSAELTFKHNNILYIINNNGYEEDIVYWFDEQTDCKREGYINLATGFQKTYTVCYGEDGEEKMDYITDKKALDKLRAKYDQAVDEAAVE